MHCVILAGGSGTRFWPLSRKKHPKQLLKIIGDESMLQITVNRLKKLPTTEEIYIITRKELQRTIKKEIKGVKKENIIIEPSAKNTAPAIALMCLRISIKYPDAIVGVFPADHLIVGHKQFEKSIDTANQIAIKKDMLLTIGIEPSFPSTAYGYIQYEDDEKDGGCRVKTFAEKPHENLANRFIKSGDFLWNAGMFIWKAQYFLEEAKQHMPELIHCLMKIKKYIIENIDYSHIWEDIKPISIDYGLMEKSKNTYVIKAKFDWNDLGSWNSLHDIFSNKTKDNVIRGKGHVIDGANNFIHSEDNFTSIIGLNNVVVISTEDSTLVVNRNMVEDVKKLVEWLNKNDHQDLT